MTRWAMVADLERCVGCQTCTAACRHTNATSPAVQWRKVLDIEAGTFPNVSRTFVPVGCQHCADPPCVHVCPTTATRQRHDGIVTIDYDLCIGCAYCEVACPYQARFFVHAPSFAYAEGAMQNEIERADERLIGVAQKCTFCSDRIDFGLDNGLTPGVDPRATPACVNACIADALHFGDLDDPNSNISRLLREQKHFRMHEELSTEPGFYYAYGNANGPDDPPAAAAPAAGAGHIRTRGVEPSHQPHWDWKAAANFMCGGAGSGLFAFVALSDPVAIDARLAGLAALALIGLGLFMLLFKIGRPLRIIHVLRQPQRSWMSREVFVAGLFFPLAFAALLLTIPLLNAAAAIAGLMFLYCQGMILQESKGIPAWREPRIVPLIVATGLAEGSGLFLVAASLTQSLAPFGGPAAAAMAILVALRAGLWSAYLAALRRSGAPTRSLEILNGLRPWLLGFGLIVPVALAVFGFAAPTAQAVLFALGGLSAFAAGWALKFVLVTRAGYNQGFALQHTPVRGAGVAGPAVKPGWLMP
jgi:phenylacetyl-CoA:acceptor oxidoreductase subunit 1